MKAAAAIKASLGRLYGTAVQVRYHDASVAQASAEHLAVLEFLRDEHLPLPAVFLNGQLLYSGSVNPLQIVADVAQVWQRRKG